MVVTLFLTSCAGSAVVDLDGAAHQERSSQTSLDPNESTETDALTLDPIKILLSLYVVRSDVEGSQLDSQRTTDELAGIGCRINELWAPAGIRFEPINVETIVVQESLLAALARGNSTVFLEQVGTAFDVPNPGMLNGFYVSFAAGANGFTPFGTTVFFVDDNPTVHDERVSSHELGHLFGLRHDLNDPDQLMFSGTNGTGLSDTEVEVARYGAEGLLVDG